MSLLTRSEVDLLVARQPLFDRTLDVVGYELLYRDATDDRATETTDHETMTNVTLANAMLGIGLEELVGTSSAWINIPQSLLEQDVWRVLDPRRCVLEVLEGTHATASAAEALQRARSAGFRIALDDFTLNGPTADLVRFAESVKVEMTLGAAHVIETTRALRNTRALTLVAEKVETATDFELAYELGFDLFQGWHFGLAETVSGRDMPPAIAAVATVMQRLRNPRATDAYVESAIQADPTLMLKLLKLANSAAYGFRGVTSARKALQLVGRDALYQWLAILLVACIPRRSGIDEERLRIALERARFCEVLGEALHAGLDPSAYFLAGLISKLEALVGVSLETMLERINAPDTVRDALRSGEGSIAHVLRLAAALEQARFLEARDLANGLGIGSRLHAAFVESARWAAEMRASIA